MSVVTTVETDGLNIVVLVGEVTSPCVERTLPNGEIASTFDISTHTETGRLSVPVTMEGECDSAVVGAPLCVVGSVRRRFFRAGGSVTSRTEVVAESVIPVRRKAQIRKALDESVANLIALQGG